MLRAFHKTLIPKYTISDLAKRLLWLLKNGKPNLPKKWESKMTEEKFGPCIYPNKADCDIAEIEKNDVYRLLMTGEASLLYKPKIGLETIEVKRDGKKKQIPMAVIRGRAPNASFDSLMRDYEKNKLQIVNSPIDISKHMDIGICLEMKKGIDQSEFMNMISDNYLNKVIHFKCYTCNLDGAVELTSIDDQLLNCFYSWKNAFLNKLRGTVDVINKKIIECFICSFIKDKVNNNVNNIDDILPAWNPKSVVTIYTIDDENNISEKKYEPTHDDIREIYNRTPIRRLIEWKTSVDEYVSEIENVKNEILNFDSTAITRVEKIIN